jgi:hypothetical protein
MGSLDHIAENRRIFGADEHGTRAIHIRDGGPELGGANALESPPVQLRDRSINRLLIRIGQQD